MIIIITTTGIILAGLIYLLKDIIPDKNQAKGKSGEE